MCFDICTINIRVSIRVRGLHLVFKKVCCVPSCFWVLWPALFSVPEKPLEHTVFMGTPSSWILIIPNQSSTSFYKEFTNGFIFPRMLK